MRAGSDGAGMMRFVCGAQSGRRHAAHDRSRCFLQPHARNAGAAGHTRRHRYRRRQGYWSPRSTEAAASRGRCRSGRRRRRHGFGRRRTPDGQEEGACHPAGRNDEPVRPQPRHSADARRGRQVLRRRRGAGRRYGHRQRPPFVHQFSIGMHAKMVQLRERWNFGSRLGKIRASARAACDTIINPPAIDVDADHRRRRRS